MKSTQCVRFMLGALLFSSVVSSVGTSSGTDESACSIGSSCCESARCGAGELREDYERILGEVLCDGRPALRVIEKARARAFEACAEPAGQMVGQLTTCEGLRLMPGVAFCEHRAHCLSAAVTRHCFRVCCTCCAEHVNAETGTLEIVDSTSSMWFCGTTEAEGCGILTIGDTVLNYDFNDLGLNLYCTANPRPVCAPIDPNYNANLPSDDIPLESIREYIFYPDSSDTTIDFNIKLFHPEAGQLENCMPDSDCPCIDLTFRIGDCQGQIVTPPLVMAGPGSTVLPLTIVSYRFDITAFRPLEAFYVRVSVSNCGSVLTTDSSMSVDGFD